VRLKSVASPTSLQLPGFRRVSAHATLKWARPLQRPPLTTEQRNSANECWNGRFVVFGSALGRRQPVGATMLRTLPCADTGRNLNGDLQS
jgi:hypothetical protein